MQRRYLFLLISISILLLTMPVRADDWNSRQRYFLESLTYPDQEWQKDDFGEETSESDRQLLENFSPRLFIGPNGLPPIDFYKDYLPHTIVRNERGQTEHFSPDRNLLKKIERDPRLYLDFQGSYAPCIGQECRDYRGKLYARIFRETLQPSPETNPSRPINIIILKYNPVFGTSGLPLGIPWYKEFAAHILGNPKDWHELDIHGAIHILLVEGQKTPFAVLLAQHNHFRTYLLNKDLDWPDDNHFPICFAVRSNEPYLCPNGTKPQKYRTVGDPTSIRYLLLGENPPLTSGEDIVYGPDSEETTEIRINLEFLPSKDPLYVSWIPLGDKRKILGIWNSFYLKGPPGINMNTWPQLRKYTDIAQFWYMEDGDQDLVELFEKDIKSFWNPHLLPVLKRNGKRLWFDYQSLQE